MDDEDIENFSGDDIAQQLTGSFRSKHKQLSLSNNGSPYKVCFYLNTKLIINLLELEFILNVLFSFQKHNIKKHEAQNVKSLRNTKETLPGFNKSMPHKTSFLK